MGQKVIFDGKIYTEPVSRARTISGVQNVGAPASFGNICIIDDGLGANYGGGKGALGAGASLRQLDDMLEEFNSAPSFKNFVKGGVLWDLADYFYAPSLSEPGASKVFLIKAAQTTQAQNLTSAWTNSFNLVLNTLEEGEVANGILRGTDLLKGYAWTLEAGVLDSAKFIFKFWKGSFRGYEGGIAEVADITLRADSADDLNGTHWLIDSFEDKYYVWYNTSGTPGLGDPLVAGRVGIEVTIATNDTNAVVATATASALDTLSDFAVPAPGAEIITITHNIAGVAADAVDGDVGGLFAVAITTQGVNGLLFDGINENTAKANPILVAESVELTSIDELKAWADSNQEFTGFFEFDASSAITGAIVVGDLAIITGFQKFTGGTEIYSPTALDHVLDTIRELDNTFFLATSFGADAAGVNNVKVLSHIVNDSEFKKFVFIGGGEASGDFGSSKTTSATLNSRYAITCHGGIEVPYILNPKLLVKKSALYKAALVMGRHAGIEPQVPGTYKDVRVTKEQHTLTANQRVDAINSGVLHTRVVNGLGIVINQSINSQQLNDFLINPDGSSPEISVERIEAQLNREIQEGATVLFIGKNRSIASKADVESYAVGYLEKQVAVPGEKDGMLIKYLNVKATRQGTSWFVAYDFEANTPINKIFTTGTIIDPSIG